MKLTPQQIQILDGFLCPYCGRKTELVDSAIIYGKSYGKIYLCKPCDAYCGVHKNTEMSLGRIANKELRVLKVKAHESFDPLWQKGSMTREKAYLWLSEKLKIPKEYTHIGMFSEDTCKKVIELCKEKATHKEHNPEK